MKMMNYIILQTFASYPAQLLLIGPLLLTFVSRFIPWMNGSSTPREISDAFYPSVLTSLNYGTAYAVPILIWIIGVLYVPIAPL